LKSGSADIYKRVGSEFDTTTSKKDLVITANNYCSDGLYRFVSLGSCPRNSSPAAVTMIKKSDLWMRDSQKDTGAEPNRSINRSQITQDLFWSPDLFNCIDDSLCDSHQGAEFKKHSPNYVNYKVRCKGTKTSKPANLFLYWTLASTGEIWKSSWITTDRNRFYNADSLKYFPMGGEINNYELGLRIGIPIPPINPLDSFKGSIGWYPPNPKWYYKIINGDTIYDKKINVCLLSRIEYCDVYPHKMKFDELLNHSVDTNIINNNIVTRNLWVEDINPENITGGNRHIPVWTMIRRTNNNYAPINLHFDALDPAYFSFGRVIATLDDSLWKAWNFGGMAGSGFLPLDSQRIEIISPAARLENIYSDSLFLGNLGFEFFSLENVGFPVVPPVFALSQYNTEEAKMYGGVLFQPNFNVFEAGDGGDNGSPMQSAEIKSHQKDDSYLVYPNPANSSLNIRMSLNKKTSQIIEISDLTGKLLQNEKLSAKEAGIYIHTMDISKLASGGYIIRIISHQAVYVKKVTILR